MLARGDGAILNTGSIASVVGGGGAAYTASKLALLGLSKSLAFDYGPKGVRGNAVLPGAIKTAMAEVEDAQIERAATQRSRPRLPGAGRNRRRSQRSH